MVLSFKRQCVFALLFAFATNCFGDQASFALSDHTADFLYSSALNERLRTDLNWMHHEDDGDLVSLGFYGAGQRGQLQGKLGAKLFWIDTDEGDATGQGIAVGGSLAWSLIDRLKLILSAHYAPSVTSFGDIDSFTQYSGELAYEVLDNANLFIGIRDIEADVDEYGDAELHKGAYVGISLRF